MSSGNVSQVGIPLRHDITKKEERKLAHKNQVEMENGK